MSKNIFQSKYIQKAINLNEIYSSKDDDNSSGSDSESDDDSPQEVNFIIDSKPDSNVKVEDKPKKKSPILESELTDDLKAGPYLSAKISPELSMKLLNEMSVKRMNEELSKKSVIKPGFEQNFCVDPLFRSRRMQKKLRKEERDKTVGPKWFGMTAEELTDEKKNDLLALRMRKGWDPKRFYKKNDSKELPKFFQTGTIIESKADFYHSRVPKKDRKRTLVEELLADADFKRFSKKKYSEALARNPYYLKMKRRKERQQLKAKGFDFNKRKKNKKSRNNNKDKQE